MNDDDVKNLKNLPGVAEPAASTAESMIRLLFDAIHTMINTDPATMPKEKQTIFLAGILAAEKVLPSAVKAMGEKQFDDAMQQAYVNMENALTGEKCTCPNCQNLDKKFNEQLPASNETKN